MTLNQNIAIDLTAVGERVYPISRCQSLFLPKFLVQAGAKITNPRDAVIAIGFEPGGVKLPFGIQDGHVVTVQGDISTLFVTVLTKGAWDVLYLGSVSQTGIFVGAQDGLSAQVDTPPIVAAPWNPLQGSRSGTTE